MTNTDFNNIKEVLKKYKEKKVQLEQPLVDYKLKCASRGVNPVYVDEFSRDFYNQLFETQERKMFEELVKKTKVDAKFEKYFRAAFFDVFHGRIIDPETL